MLQFTSTRGRRGRWNLRYSLGCRLASEGRVSLPLQETARRSSPTHPAPMLNVLGVVRPSSSPASPSSCEAPPCWGPRPPGRTLRSVPPAPRPRRRPYHRRGTPPQVRGRMTRGRCRPSCPADEEDEAVASVASVSGGGGRRGTLDAPILPRVVVRLRRVRGRRGGGVLPLRLPCRRVGILHLGAASSILASPSAPASPARAPSSFSSSAFAQLISRWKSSSPLSF